MLMNLGEVLVSAVFLVLLVLKLDPFGLLMPNRVQMAMLALVLAVFGLYAGIIFRQKARDERDALHIDGPVASHTSAASRCSWRPSRSNP